MTATLKEKSAEFNRLTTELATLTRAAGRAREQLQEAQQSVAEFDSLNSQVTKWRAGQVKAGGDPRKLPDGLKAKLAAKDTAAAELELAQGTEESINDDLASTQRRLNEMGSELRESAIRELEAYAECNICDELVAMQLRSSLLVQMLKGLQELNFVKNGYNYSAGQGGRINHALSVIGYKFPPNADPVLRMKGRWEKTLQDLIRNPNTPLDDHLKPVLPADYQN